MDNTDNHVDGAGEEANLPKMKDNPKSKKESFVSAMFLSGVAGMSILGGFATTLALQKKKDPMTFTKSMIGTHTLPETGVALATRALFWGTAYAVGGFSLFCFVVWKLMGVHSLQEFTEKMQRTMPKLPKNEPTGRSDFKSVRELVNYIIDEDKREKAAKKT